MRHGIYRDFPLTFNDAGGTLREVTFSLLDVSRDGAAEPYHTERTHGVIRIYAGNKDVLIRPGEHTYVFALPHRAADALVRRQAGAQLERHRQFLALPDRVRDLPPAAVRRRSAGALDRLHRPLGARGTDWHGSVGPLGTLTVSTTRRLAPGEGLDRGRRASRDGGRAAQRQHAVLVPNLG